MRFARLSNGTEVFWGLIQPDGETARRVDGAFAEWAPSVCHGAGEAPLRGEPIPLSALTVEAPVAAGAIIVAVGANYRSHLSELGWEIPDAPIAFLKPARSVIRGDSEIRYPALTSGLDYEVELVAVMGCPRSHDPLHPSRCLLGYTVGNDITARDIQFRQAGGNTILDLYSAKTMDDSCPIGPWIVTPDELGGPLDLELSLKVNGETRQSARTTDMIWDIDAVLRYADARTSLRSGDLVFTGTPGGVAFSSGKYLQPGDIVETAIERIGTIRNTVGKHPA